jgi:hypothetical protein
MKYYLRGRRENLVFHKGKFVAPDGTVGNSTARPTLQVGATGIEEE